jgi:hypothetical protein
MHFWREKYFQTLKDIAAEFKILERFTSSMGDRSVTNQMKEMAQRSELYVLRRAHGIYFNLVPILRLRSMEALYLAGEGNSRIDVNVMKLVS